MDRELGGVSPAPVHLKQNESMTTVTVFAPLGPNPAPLIELLWALHRQRAWIACDVFAVIDERGRHYLEREVLAKGSALEDLTACLGTAPVTVHQRVVDAAPGADDDPAGADAYNATIWQAARDAIDSAGDDGIVVFGLCAGRRRTMTAAATMAFQLLARKQDLCLDVRVSDARAEGGSGFFFPEQTRQDLMSTSDEHFVAADVQVQLVPVTLPRLRGLLPAAALTTYASALNAGQLAIDIATMPSLVIDLVKGVATVDGATMQLSTSELLWYATLAVARQSPGNAEGWIDVSNLGLLKTVAGVCADRVWSETVKAKALRWLLGQHGKEVYKTKPDDADLADDLKKTRSETLTKVAEWAQAHRPSTMGYLVPEKDRRFSEGALTARQRLRLPPDRISVLGGPAWPL
jgi:CRISPR-associated protein (TIGR02584 family)